MIRYGQNLCKVYHLHQLCLPFYLKLVLVGSSANETMGAS